MRYIFAAMLALMIPSVSYAQATPASATGRYIIVQGTLAGQITILLDTSTGKSWQMARISDSSGHPGVWIPMARMDNQEERSWFGQHYPTAPNQPSEAKNSN